MRVAAGDAREPCSPAARRAGKARGERARPRSRPARSARGVVFIDVEKATWPVTVMCRILQVSPSGYYAWRNRPESAHDLDDLRIGVLIGEAFARSRSTYGSIRVHAALKANGLHVSRKRVMRLMRRLGLRGRTRRAFVVTTDSVKGAATADNLVARDFTATGPNQKWVGDVTYLRTPEGWIYLAIQLDLYSRRIVGWALSPVNDHRLALAALQAALHSRRPAPGLICHTDQGSPYVGAPYQKALAAVGAVCSMSRRGNCLDNAAMESWNATVKCELGEVFQSLGDAKRRLFDFIKVFYNQERLHSALGYQSPAAFERSAYA